MATAKTIPQVVDMKGLALILDQLISPAGVAVNVSAIAAAVSGSGLLVLSAATIAAAGTTVANATPITTSVVAVTGANGTVGAVLPATPVAGTVVFVKNVAGAVLKLWPDASATINAIGSNAHLPMAANTSAVLIATSPTQWYSISLLPS